MADGILAVLGDKTEIGVQAAAAQRQDRLRHEGQDDAVIERHFPRQQAEQEDVVDRPQRLVIGQRELELRGVIFRGETVNAKARGTCRFPDGISELQRVGEASRAVNIGTWRVIGNQLSILVMNKGIGLQFQTDLGREAQFLPVADGPLQ